MNRIPPFIKWLVGTLLALALLTGTFFVKGQQDLEVAGNQNSVDAAQIETLLIQFAGTDESTGGLAILIKEPNESLQVFNISPRVAMSFNQAGIMTLAAAGTQLQPGDVAQGVSIATGIRIDGILTLQRLAVAGLVDSLGGIYVDAQSGLLVSSGDDPAMYVSPGRQLVDGQHAAGYAMVKQFTESESNQVARMNEVLASIFSGIPEDSGKLDETFAALGSLARSNISISEIANFFTAINELSLWQTAEFKSVAVDTSELELMPDSNWLRIRQPETWNLVSKFSPSAKLTFSPSVMRVEVTSEEATDRSVIAGDLAQIGLGFIDGGFSQTPEQTLLILSPKVDIDAVIDLRSKLGLPNAQIEWDFELGEYSDLQLIIGADYRDRNLQIESVN